MGAIEVTLKNRALIPQSLTFSLRTKICKEERDLFLNILIRANKEAAWERWSTSDMIRLSDGAVSKMIIIPLLNINVVIIPRSFETLYNPLMSIYVSRLRLRPALRINKIHWAYPWCESFGGLKVHWQHYDYIITRPWPAADCGQEPQAPLIGNDKE